MLMRLVFQNGVIMKEKILSLSCEQNRVDRNIIKGKKCEKSTFRASNVLPRDTCRNGEAGKV